MSRRTRDIGRLGAGMAGVAFTLLPVAAMALGAPAGTQPANAQACVASSAETLSVPLEPQPEVLKGAPYSAVGTTEVVTTQADGNRVTRTNTMRYFRDGAGRTRTEYQLAAIGPFVVDEAQSIVTITDPVAGTRYVLHPEQKRADVFNLAAKGTSQASTSSGAIFLGSAFTMNGRSTPPGVPGTTAARPSGFSQATETSATTSRLQSSSRIRRERERTEPGTATSSPGSNFDMLVVSNGMPVPVCRPAAMKNAEPTSIGERRIEGLNVTGSRLEFTLEAGAVGNDKPITVRTDQWFSPDLGVVVSSTNHDPMIGDSTYRLEQINRAEPDAGLFKVPADYTKNVVRP
jgi:hypothetical protein